MADITLRPLHEADQTQFIMDNQEAFRYGALEEFGLRDDRFEEDGEIISRDTILRSIREGQAFRIMQDGKAVGGAVIRTAYDSGELELLFVTPTEHSKGIGFAAWSAIEAMHPEVTVWETFTPYFEKRNLHFYVNRCGFHIVEFFSKKHRAPNDPDGELSDMFRFEKRLPSTPESVSAQIRRITHYEDMMRQAMQCPADDPALQETVQALSDYYGSDAWKRDFAADEAGLLPQDLKRGVLSEDGLSDFLDRFEQ